MKVNFGVDDLTKSALKRLVTQLLAADDGDEKAILDKLSQDADKERNDLADLVEEKRGKPAAIASEDDMPTKKEKA